MKNGRGALTEEKGGVSIEGEGQRQIPMLSDKASENRNSLYLHKIIHSTYKCTHTLMHTYTHTHTLKNVKPLGLTMLSTRTID